MSTKLTKEDLINSAIEQGIVECCDIIVNENDAELQRFLSVKNAGGPDAYLEHLLATEEYEVVEAE